MPGSARDFALGLLGRMPQVANNPNAQSMIQVIQNGDAKKGEEIARNLCETYGIKPEDAVQQARSFFRV